MPHIKTSRASQDKVAVTPAGMVHLADSMRNPPNGEYIDSFGPPGDPTQPAKTVNDKRIGSSPSLLRKYNSKQRQK